MLALYEIQNPQLVIRWWRELLRPIAFGLFGLLGIYLPPLAARWFSAGPSKVDPLAWDIGSAVTNQPLLWERLLPNATYPLGILIAMAWAGLPLLLLISWLIFRRSWRINVLQELASGIILTVLLGIGIVASTKIGGGSNLHNLDMFWITLILLFAWMLRLNWSATFKAPPLILVIVMAGPVLFSLRSAPVLALPPADQVQNTLSTIRLKVDQTKQRNEQILFMDQRQLLTFGMIDPGSTTADYEKKRMMDWSMTGNSEIFKQFNSDLATGRFGLIITEPLNTGYNHDQSKNFNEENIAWITFISRPILCYYEPVFTDATIGVQILERRQQPQVPIPDYACPTP
jgi:hypothetical protein